jgi:hypothetical protein
MDEFGFVEVENLAFFDFLFHGFHYLCFEGDIFVAEGFRWLFGCRLGFGEFPWVVGNEEGFIIFFLFPEVVPTLKIEEVFKVVLPYFVTIFGFQLISYLIPLFPIGDRLTPTATANQFVELKFIEFGGGSVGCHPGGQEIGEV